MNKGQVREVTIQGNTINGKFTDGRTFSTYSPNDPNLVTRLIDKGVHDPRRARRTRTCRRCSAS